MNTISRPNRDALQKALDIYRDAMRPFLIRCLRQVRGMNVQNVISHSLGNRRADEFERALARSTGNVESAIDINDFPTLVSRNWHRETFETKLNGDKTFQNQLWLITDARNHTVHTGTQDLDDDYTRTHLFLIADVLERIGASDGKQVVQSIRDELFSAPIASSTTTSQTEEVLPEAEEETPLPKPSISKLAAWRDVIRPNLDVAQGNFREDDLWGLLAKHVYLPRLRNIGVLLECIKQGVPERAFGYAKSYAESEFRENEDEKKGSYTGSRFGEDLGFGLIDATGLLVNPDMAQQEAQEAPTVTPAPIETSNISPDPDPVSPTLPEGPTHFIATKTMEAEISFDDINLLRDEIIRTMRNDGAEIRITITIEARNSEGFSENAARSIRQNSDVLGVNLKQTKG